jgi:hypothetical protein
MSKALEKARQQFEEGKIKSASGTLWEVRNEVAAGKADEAQGMLNLALALRDRAEGWVIEECDEHINVARLALAEADRARFLASLHTSAIVVVPHCRVIGGSGINVAASTETTWELIFAEDQVLLCQTSPLAKESLSDTDWRGFGLLKIGWEGLHLYIGGAGEMRRGGGFFAGGFGLLGAAEGMLISSMANALTSSSTIDTVLRLQMPSAELYLFHDTLAPQALRTALSPVFDRLRQAEAPSAPPANEAGDDIIDRLRKLADLLDRGTITHDEFTQLKAKLLSDSSGRSHSMRLRSSRSKPGRGRP